MNITFRYFFLQQLKTFFLFIASFSLLFILLDFSLRFKWFTLSSIPFKALFLYYLFALLTKAPILFPLASLLTTVRTLSQSMANKEIIALLAGGLSPKSLFKAFWAFNFLFMVLLYFNAQSILPEANAYIDHFEDKYFHGISQQGKKAKLHTLKLANDTTLLYKVFHPSSLHLEDVFWLQSFEKIAHIKRLDLSMTPPTGYFVDFLVENQEGLLEKENSHSSLSIPSIYVPSSELSTLLRPTPRQSLSELFFKLPSNHLVNKEEDALTLTHFHHKLALPFTLLLTFLLPTPYLLNFSRSVPTFYIFSFSLIFFICFFMVLEACVILAESSVIYPPLAIWLPFFLFFAIACFKLTPKSPYIAYAPLRSL